MSIDARHAYRFGFLKSEEWQSLRAICLALDEGKCRLCGKVDPSNDAHHLFYRKNWKKTRVEDLLTLCRSCHKKTHDLGSDVLLEKWWNKYYYLFGKRERNGCQCCLLSTSNPIVKRIKDDATMSFCPRCWESIKKLQEQEFRSFWKALDIVKNERRVFSIREFHTKTLKSLISHGPEKEAESRRWQKALRRAGDKIRKYLLTESQLSCNGVISQ